MMTPSPKLVAWILGGVWAFFVAPPCLATESDASAADSRRLSRNEPARNADSDPPGPDLAESNAVQKLDANNGLSGESELSRNFALYESGQYEACASGLRGFLIGAHEKRPQRPEL